MHHNVFLVNLKRIATNTSWTSLALRAQMLLLLLATTASAQPKVTLAQPKPGKIDVLVPIMAQSARVAAVSEAHGLIAFGHFHTYADAHVSLVKLDAKGMPAAYATQVKLPKPAGLVKNKNYVTGVAFHPKLPLLYIWQDVDVAYSNPVPPGPPETMQFDHLCVLNLAKDPPELVVSVCRGLEFMHGQQGGAVAVDPTGSYLYVPNMRELKNAGSLRFGRYPLDADGLPMLAESKEPLPARVKKVTEVSAAEKFSPPQVTPIEYDHLFNHNTYGSGHTFVPIEKDVVITSGYHGLMTWRPEDKHAALHGLPLRNAGYTQFAVHPTLPALFATAPYHVHPDSFFRVAHSEGYLSLLPKQYVIPDSKLSGPPAILSKQQKLAVGGNNVIYLVSLNAKGFPAGDVTHTLVNCPQVQAMVYSEKYDRLYLGVEISK